MHVAVVIPAYNESKVIQGVIKGLPKKLPNVDKITSIVVDDNSTDETKLAAESCGALCVRHEINLGVGGATVTGLELAKRVGADIVVTMDADGQHSPEDMKGLIEPIINREADVVLGSRLKSLDGDMPRFKIVGNQMLNIITYVFSGLWVSDSQSGYKAFSRKSLKAINLRTRGYEICSEIIGEIKRKKLRFKEVPIQTIYTDYSRSKGQLALNAVNITVALLVRKIW